MQRYWSLAMRRETTKIKQIEEAVTRNHYRHDVNHRISKMRAELRRA